MDHYNAFCLDFADIFDELETARLKEFKSVQGTTPNLLEDIKTNMGVGKVRKEYAYLDLLQKIQIGKSLDQQKQIFDKRYGRKTWGWTVYLRQLAEQTGCYYNALAVSLFLYRNLDVIIEQGWLGQPGTPGKSTEFVKRELHRLGKRNKTRLHRDAKGELERSRTLSLNNIIGIEDCIREEAERLRRSGESNESRLERELEESKEVVRSHEAVEQMYRDKIAALEQELAVAQVLAIAKSSHNIEQHPELSEPND